MSLKTRLSAALAAMLLAVLSGTAGYHFIEGWSVFDSLYMTVITLGTVGYGETHPLHTAGRIFTIFLILFGIGILTYSFSVITAFLVEGDLKHVIRRRRMERKIKSLDGHYIICGGGRTGRYLIDELVKTNRPFVVVDQDPALVQTLAEEGFLVVAGDSSLDETLKQAGIERAQGLAACLPSDKDNLFVTITARGLNPRLRVVSKLVDREVGDKLLRSGADAVVSPTSIGGLRLASELVRPTAAHFLDQMLRAGDESLRIDEAAVGNVGAGKTLEEATLRPSFDLMVLAVRPAGKADYHFHPPAHTPLQKGDVLVVMGHAGEVGKLQAALA